MKRNSASIYNLLIAVSLILPLAAAMLFPIITDEAYYVDWAMRTGWPRAGFFDHPPFVSWIAGLTAIHHDIFMARIVVWLLHLLSIFFVWKTARLVVPERAAAATLLIASTLGAMANGFLLTPDAGIIAMWTIAIHEALLAIQGHPRRWITAGLMTGLGLWSKYTMVLIGPVFLWGMLRDARKQLVTPWPYLGGVVCALVFAPHLWWQSQNDWVTFRFQFGHGFSVNQSIEARSTLPAATDPLGDDLASRRLHDELFAAMSKVSGFAETVEKPKPEKTKWEKAVQYTGDFWGGIAGLWGFYAILGLLYLLTKSIREKNQNLGSKTAGMGLIEAGAFFPIIFFALISPFSKIEANWPAMHMGSLAIWISSRRQIPMRFSMAAIVTHSAALLGIIWILNDPGSFPGARNNRLLLESKGYQTLGEWVKKDFQGSALAVDSYQLKSAIRYYAPEIPVAQWPGITRGSEYTRGDADDKVVEQQLLNQKTVSIISLKPAPKVILGFTAESFSGMRVCPDGNIGVFNINRPVLPCEKGLREWWVTTYRNQNPR